MRRSHCGKRTINFHSQNHVSTFSNDEIFQQSIPSISYYRGHCALSCAREEEEDDHLGSGDREKMLVCLWQRVIWLLFSFIHPSGTWKSTHNFLLTSMRQDGNYYFHLHFTHYSRSLNISSFMLRPCYINHSLLANISTGDPSGSSHGQPLNCQAGPCTNTATTRSLQEETFRDQHENVTL